MDVCEDFGKVEGADKDDDGEEEEIKGKDQDEDEFDWIWQILPLFYLSLVCAPEASPGINTLEQNIISVPRKNKSQVFTFSLPR